jgi:hypothetical protein
MKTATLVTNQLKNKRLIASTMVLAVALLLASLGGVSHGVANNTMYLTPASGSYTVGSTVTVAVRENSGSTDVNAVEADLSYNSTDLQYLSSDFSTSAFEISATSSGGSGVVSMARGTTNASLSGDQLIGNLSFKVLAAGTGTVTFTTTSGVASNGTNTNPSYLNANAYTYTNTNTNAGTCTYHCYYNSYS